jgi:hypothetical protein
MKSKVKSQRSKVKAKVKSKVKGQKSNIKWQMAKMESLNFAIWHLNFDLFFCRARG